MFGDAEYVGNSEQENYFSQFIRDPIDVAILVGSSGAVPTNDYIAYGLKQRGTKIIYINPDLSANRIVQADYFLPLRSHKAFLELDQYLDKITK